MPGGGSHYHRDTGYSRTPEFEARQVPPAEYPRDTGHSAAIRSVILPVLLGFVRCSAVLSFRLSARMINSIA
jgi:hypothetical protein